jgi:hypothetical protein
MSVPWRESSFSPVPFISRSCLLRLTLSKCMIEAAANEGSYGHLQGIPILKVRVQSYPLANSKIQMEFNDGLNKAS